MLFPPRIDLYLGWDDHFWTKLETQLWRKKVRIWGRHMLAGLIWCAAGSLSPKWRFITWVQYHPSKPSRSLLSALISLRTIQLPQD